MKVFAAVLAALLSPIGLVIAAVGALGAYILHATGAGAKALGWLGEKFGALRDEAREAWGGISAALASGNIGLAARILWLTLKLQWQKGVAALTQLWIALKSKLLSVLDDFRFGAMAVWIELASAIRGAWARLVAALKSTWLDFKAWHRQVTETMGKWLAKRWVEIEGVFDPKIDVEQRKRDIDTISVESTRRFELDQADAQRQIRQGRDKDLAGIESDRRRKLEETGQADAAAQAARQGDNARRIRDAQAAVDAARTEWQKAIAQARKPPAADRKPAEPPGSLKPPADLLKSLKDQVAGLGSALDLGKTSVVGTFSGVALAGLGMGRTAERTARAAEETARNTRDLARNRVAFS